ncbi:MAG: DUF2089 domain-containing protein [Alicyclobacillus herbarius]|uniref:DUF2089 domain-containing protein n=1 Tax=Alicyclobacillus herbarius TaxID=122960 RepID=UPI002354F5F4|nr:DUF2089 domain-containing protein [Alicyclobacillus herbarius]MCL6631023.1 DUF2089 domain-containing protein [Alicyclobacillus herbarius]
MDRTLPVHCPACQQVMEVSELTCPACDTRVQGRFPTPALLRLTVDQMQFVETFLRCRGNIKEVERDLKISYPTVRSRLDQVIRALGYPVAAVPEDERTEQVLNGLDTGELTFEQAMELIREENRDE